MEKFLNSLYSYEYFGFYLIISIIVLVILFLIILFFGKKDQKHREIEATKKLQQINAEAFKEDSLEEKLEVNNISSEKNLEDTIVVPNIEEVPTLNFVETNDEIPEPELPVVEENSEVIKEEKVEMPTFEEIKVDDNIEPILERIEEKPLVFDNTNIFTNDFVKEVQELEETPVLKQEEIKQPEEEIEVPVFNFDEVVKEVEEVKNTNNYSKGPQIFSSVYVPEKKEEKEEIELPKVEVEVEKALEDLEFELPTLKKEEPKVVEENNEKIEIPVLNDYNLDELSGETYTINK